MMMAMMMMIIMMMMMTELITDSVIPDDCHIFFQRAAFPSSPVTCNLDDGDDEYYFDYDDLSLTEIKVRIRVGMSMRMWLGW